ncbi:response regulator [Acidisphaera sp. L21]|jgi:CheY-like chemotaxis protein|uniref:response regulator n=1 Tax=Acidisphaera sp. L21 TaxID=1641851 RepID=UPI00131B8979|nr:response regulator [Acidisphaera sp. L21]
MTAFRREDLLRALPYARRYARALCGGQERGDALVTDAVRVLLAAEQAQDAEARHALYRAVTKYAGEKAIGAGLEGALTQSQRKLLLLTSLEEVSLPIAASLLELDVTEAAIMLTSARDQLRSAAATDVLIIEDEPIIAMDIEELVANCGHRVIGVAATEADAVAIAERSRPGLILADINLGAGGDGTSAVSRIMRNHYAPVIFVTAYPERLLTGEALEPAFVITKPFEPLTLAIATYQAVTGGVHLE